MIRHPSHRDRAPLPFLDPHYFGLLIANGSKKAVVWSDGCIETDGPGDSGWLQDVHDALEAAAPLQKLSDVALVLSGAGFEDRGSRRYDFRSGDLYWCARAQARRAREYLEDREAIMREHGGRHPPLDGADWPRWEQVGWDLRSSSLAARLLGFASIEALVNEVLAQRFSEDYAELEPTSGKRPASFTAKLVRLVERLDLDPRDDWIREIKKGLGRRVEISHHKPRYVDSSADDRESVELSDLTHPDAIDKWLRAIDRGYEAIFAAFGVDVPPTHLPLIP